jgi:hypothetical protein
VGNKSDSRSHRSKCATDSRSRAPIRRVPRPLCARRRSLQGERFDADGNCVRRWVPELARVPREIHSPPVGGSAPRARSGWRQTRKDISETAGESHGRTGSVSTRRGRTSRVTVLI